jgi:hypothetical protein
MGKKVDIKTNISGYFTVGCRLLDTAELTN